MKPFWRDDHTIRLTLIGASLTLIYLTVLLPLGFLEGARAASADTLLKWRNAFQDPPREIRDILLVTVDDESQRHINQKWPWDRALFAAFLHRIKAKEPKLVLFDFAFVGESSPESDEALAQAIRQGPPTLLGAYLDSKGELVLPHPMFLQAGGSPGLIYKPLDRDYVIRRMLTTVHLGPSSPLYGIEVKAAAIALSAHLEDVYSLKPVLTIGSRHIPVGRLGELPIHYFVSDKNKNLSTVSFWQVLDDAVAADLIRNKLVIVGSDREITHDVHSTPLGRMAGLAIEANGILTLLTQRYLKELPVWLLLPTGFLLALTVLHVSYYATLPVGFVLTLLLIGLAMGLEFALAFQDFSLDFVSPILLGSLAWLSGFLYKHGWLAFGALRLRQQAILDSFTGTFTARYFHLRLQEELQLSRRMKRPVSVILVQVIPVSQLLLSEHSEVAHNRFQSLVQTIRQALPAKSLMGRLQEDRLGILLVHSGLEVSTKIAHSLQEVLRSTPEAVALSLVSTEQELRRTVDDLIRCANSALSRARAAGACCFEIYDPTLDKVSPIPEKDSLPQEKQSHLEYVASELEERNRALEEALSQLRQVHKQLESAFLEVTKSLVLALETKDAYTAGHLERVSRYSTRLAEALHLPKEEVDAIREAALLHDIGKIGLPDEVLHKVGKLTDEERGIIQQHLAIGAKILEPMKFFKAITTLIYHHHEWYDGKGYPHGLAGDFIPAGAQIIAIADSFDAMTTHRGYQRTLTMQEALAELKEGAGTQFNPAYVEKFSQVITEEGPQLAGYTAA